MKQDVENKAGADDTAVFVSPVARVVRFEHLGLPVFFTVASDRDAIQKVHLKGMFYEPEEIAIMARYFPVGGRLLDIGSNVGNHAIYFSKFMHAKKVTLIEPNPKTIEVLESNVMLNGLGDVCDRSLLGIGLSDGEHAFGDMATPPRNWGGAKVAEGEGEIPLSTLDALIPEETYDLVKIDVEGLEMKVLKGMAGFVRRTRAPIFIEVDNVNDAAFHDWIAKNNYDILDDFKRYRRNTNYMITPREES